MQTEKPKFSIPNTCLPEAFAIQVHSVPFVFQKFAFELYAQYDPVAPLEYYELFPGQRIGILAWRTYPQVHCRPFVLPGEYARAIHHTLKSYTNKNKKNKIKGIKNVCFTFEALEEHPVCMLYLHKIYSNPIACHPIL